MFVQRVWRSGASERSEYRHYFVGLMTDFMGEFINLYSNFSLMHTKYALISASRSNSAITINDMFPVLSTLHLHRLAPISIIPFRKWVGR